MAPHLLRLPPVLLLLHPNYSLLFLTIPAASLLFLTTKDPVLLLMHPSAAPTHRHVRVDLHRRSRRRALVPAWVHSSQRSPAHHNALPLPPSRSLTTTAACSMR